MKHLAKLVGLGSKPIRGEPVDTVGLGRRFGAAVTQQLERLLAPRNGFYAFESALHVFPDLGASPNWGLAEWNEPALWRSMYGDVDIGVCFAEDVFGRQFCISDRGVTTFEPETGEVELVAKSLEGWADKILEDYDYWTGHSVARAWQQQHGGLPSGVRLVPMTPFVLGGSYDLANVRAIEAVKGMRYRAEIAVQIRDLPDGASVVLKPIE